jgi:hypothetical protein
MQHRAQMGTTYFPYELTAVGKTQNENYLPRPSFHQTGLIPTKLTQEQLLWLHVALQGIAEQDVSNILRLGSESVLKRQQEAVIWVGSEDFEYVCELAGIGAELLRRLTPAKAHQTLTELNQRLYATNPEPEVDPDEFGALSEVRYQSSETIPLEIAPVGEVMQQMCQSAAIIA